MAYPLISDDIISFATRSGVSDSQEIRWMMEILLANRMRSNPVYDLMGGIGSSKPFWEVMDFKKTRGQEIVVTLDRPLGGGGTQGAATANRVLDNVESTLGASYRAKVGLMAHVVGGEESELAFLVSGQNWSPRNKEKIKQWTAWKKADEIQWEMMVRAHSRNTLYPNGKTSRDALVSNDYLNLSTISRAKELLVSNQAKPCGVAKTKAGAEILKYFFLSNNYALANMEESTAYMNLLANAGNRGDTNYLFAGGQPEWAGSYIHSWNIENGTQLGAKGAPVAPIAYLGTQMPAESDTDLTGNPITAHASNTDAPFFQYYPNAALIGHEGTKLAADTSTVRYVGIKIIDPTHADVGKIAIYSYTTNNKNQLSGLIRLASNTTGTNETTVGSMTYGSGPWTTTNLSVGTVPVGSPIYQVNAKGQPWVTTFGLGQAAVLTGWGNLRNDGGAQPGRRLYEEQDAGRLFAEGWEDVWGCRACEDADNMVNGYVKIESAYSPEGWPEIV